MFPNFIKNTKPRPWRLGWQLLLFLRNWKFHSKTRCYALTSKFPTGRNLNWLIRTTTIFIVQPKSYSTNNSIVIFIKHHTQASLFIMMTLSKTQQLSGIFYFDLSTVPSIQRNKLYVQIHILKADEHLLSCCDGVSCLHRKKSKFYVFTRTHDWTTFEPKNLKKNPNEEVQMTMVNFNNKVLND